MAKQWHLFVCVKYLILLIALLILMNCLMFFQYSRTIFSTFQLNLFPPSISLYCYTIVCKLFYKLHFEALKLLHWVKNCWYLAASTSSPHLPSWIQGGVCECSAEVCSWWFSQRHNIQGEFPEGCIPLQARACGIT